MQNPLQERTLPTAEVSSLFPKTQAHFGVNLAGAEFGNDFPGVYALHYIYPSAEVLDYYQAKGRTLIRLPFHWERIQNSFYSPLDADELDRLRTVLQAAHEREMKVILDVHNYGRFYFSDERGPQIIGSEAVPYEAYADLWSRLVAALKDEPAIWAYGLMNEPHDMEDGSRWPIAAQVAIDAIRELDMETTITVSGDDFSSSRNWRIGNNETLNERVSDPADNLLFEAHCYFDLDNSGTYKKSYDDEKASVNCGIEYVRPFIEWCEEKGVKGFIGEYGVPDTDTRWLVTMDRFMSYLNEHGVSSAYWAGGPWWGDDALAIEPVDARAQVEISEVVDRPQMLILRQYPS